MSGFLHPKTLSAALPYAQALECQQVACAGTRRDLNRKTQGAGREGSYAMRQTTTRKCRPATANRKLKTENWKLGTGNW